MDLKQYTSVNREAWNEGIRVQRKSRSENLVEEFKKLGYSTLDETITAKLLQIGIKDKTVCQLCCNNGRELLSLLNLGVGYGVGFDIADEAIDEANQLNESAKLNCEFVRTDIYDISESYFGKFDLVYISIGALCWMPDLERFFEITNKLLKPGGYVVIYEMHPITNTIAITTEKNFTDNDTLKICYKYFRRGTLVCNDGIDYVGKTTYKAKTSYDFAQQLGEIITAMAQSGIRIEQLMEYQHDISCQFEHLGSDSKLPLSYYLFGRKEKE